LAYYHWLNSEKEEEEEDSALIHKHIHKNK